MTALDALREYTTDLLRFRHNQAHNGDILESGRFEDCDLCEHGRDIVAAAAPADLKPHEQAAIDRRVREMAES